MKKTLKTYPAPWEGRVIFACRKCQKKLKGSGELAELAKLKKTVKRHNKENPGQSLEVIGVPCMDLCPKNGVTACDPRDAGRLVILRSADDLEYFRQGR